MGSSTLGEKCLAALRTELIEGRHAAGAELKEAEICARTGVSRTTVRFALNALHREGLLEYQPQRGYRVRRFTAATVRLGYEVRGALEGLACRLLAESPDRETIADRLEPALELGRQLLAVRNPAAFETERWRQMNIDFHDIIVAASDPLFAQLSEFASRGPMVAASAIADWREQPDLRLLQVAQNDHEKVVACIRSGQGSRAEMIMREHLVNAGDVIFDTLRVHGHPDGATASENEEDPH